VQVPYTYNKHHNANEHETEGKRDMHNVELQLVPKKEKQKKQQKNIQKEHYTRKASRKGTSTKQHYLKQFELNAIEASNPDLSIIETKSWT